MSVPDTFRALISERDEDGDGITRRVGELGPEDLPEGDVTIRVAYSSVNYKDGLAVSPTGNVAKVSPLVPGIDLAGEVVASESPDVAVGDAVLVHGYDVGVARHGGFAEYARVRGEWAVPLPDGLSARGAMALGTAGYTAGLSVQALEERGLAPDQGPVLVLGATGGVGSTAVGILAARGYEVVASTGKTGEGDFLRALGAGEVLTREETTAESKRPLESQRWAAVVDPAGGPGLAYALRTLRYGGAVASCGLTGGLPLQTTILPFILRNVALLGIDSVGTPLERRRQVWGRLANDLRPRGLEESLAREIGLDEVDPLLDEMLEGRGRGRTVVRIEH